ncbi:MAG: hypothetical protein J07HQX50_00544, partial [Haloquadratum sp. J07HQX50]
MVPCVGRDTLKAQFTVQALLIVICCGMLLSSVSLPVTAQSESAQAVNATGSITSVMPNPVTENDAGEFVIVETGPGSQYQLTDGVNNGYASIIKPCSLFRDIQISLQST